MKFEMLWEGFVTRRIASDARPIAVGPRFARVGNELLCSYMVQSKLGVNDFFPLIARSNDNGRSWGEGEPMWPHHAAAYSIFGAITPTPVAGELLYFGARYVIGCGDGFADRCLVQFADRTFAREGSYLHRYCLERGLAHTPFTELYQAAEAVRQAR